MKYTYARHGYAGQDEILSGKIEVCFVLWGTKSDLNCVLSRNTQIIDFCVETLDAEEQVLKNGITLFLMDRREKVWKIVEMFKKNFPELSLWKPPKRA